MVDDMKILNGLSVIWLWLFTWREHEQSAKKNAEATMSSIEQLLAMGDVLNISIEKAIHDTKRLSNKSRTRPK